MPLTEEQRAIRRKGVTGSEIAAIVGLNPYKSPQEIWEDKMGLREPDPELENNPNIERGVYLEPALLNWTQKRIGYPVMPNAQTFVCPENELVIATPDGFAYPESRNNLQTRQCVEVKAPSPRTYEDWGDPEEDQTAIPAYYIPQVMFEMKATGAREALVSTLIGGQLRVYRLPYNQPLVDKLVSRAEDFWGFVVHQEPPPIDFTRQVERDWLKKILKNQKSDEMKEYAGPDAEGVDEEIRKFLDVKERAEKLQEELEGLKSFLQFFVGDAAGLTTPSFKVTWKQSKATWKTDYKRFVNTIRKAFPQHADQFDRILRECDYSADGSRRFLVTANKEGTQNGKRRKESRED